MKPVSASRGFTLIELLFVVAIVAILASIALPSYQNYVKKGHASTAASDLSALASSVENHFQRTLSYPAASSDPKSIFKTWAPASKLEAFKFEYITNTATSAYDNKDENNYFLKAIGQGQMKNCDLELWQDNYRTVSSANCGGFTW